MGGKKLITLQPKGKFIFVGDTHGDLDASHKVIEKYLKKENKIVFLGDYIDRGNNSRENIDYLLKIREKNPRKVYLLLGNHDASQIVECFPKDFWDSLNEEEINYYTEKFSNLPLAISIGNIIALHGALPSIKSLEEINKIEDGKDNWIKIVWGDFQEREGKYLGDYVGRPQFGRDHFNGIMKRISKEILIRSHQQDAPEAMYDKRCLTLFTSSAYGVKRSIAIANFKKDIKSIDDLIIRRI